MSQYNLIFDVLIQKAQVQITNDSSRHNINSNNTHLSILWSKTDDTLTLNGATGNYISTLVGELKNWEREEEEEEN